MCPKSPASGEDANRHLHIKGLDRSVTAVANFVSGTVPLCVTLVCNGEPHSGKVYGNNLNWGVRLFDHIDQRQDVVRSRNCWMCWFALHRKATLLTGVLHRSSHAESEHKEEKP